MDIHSCTTYDLSAYAPASRQFQGIPGIAAASHGSLLVTFYTGGEGEGPDNHVVLAR